MNNLPVERPDTIASVSPPEPLGAGGADVTLGTRGAIFLAKIAKVCRIRISIRFYCYFYLPTLPWSARVKEISL